MNEVDKLIELLNQKQELAALLAPSFPIVYKYPEIVGRLKRLGFSYVLEVAAGAKITNASLANELKTNPESRFITSPCASFVRLIRTKYPHLQKYLSKSDSPMIASAKIAKEKWQNAKPVFIGPCLAKKKEAGEDNPELGILVLTYKEMNEVFKKLETNAEPFQEIEGFDISEKETRIYPISGGLAKTSGIKEILSDDEIQVVSGLQNCTLALKNFEKNTSLRLLDILFCDGGCINGPGIYSTLSMDERRAKVVDYWENKD